MKAVRIVTIFLFLYIFLSSENNVFSASHYWPGAIIGHLYIDDPDLPDNNDPGLNGVQVAFSDDGFSGSPNYNNCHTYTDSATGVKIKRYLTVETRSSSGNYPGDSLHQHWTNDNGRFSISGGGGTIPNTTPPVYSNLQSFVLTPPWLLQQCWPVPGKNFCYDKCWMDENINYSKNTIPDNQYWISWNFGMEQGFSVGDCGMNCLCENQSMTIFFPEGYTLPQSFLDRGFSHERGHWVLMNTNGFGTEQPECEAESNRTICEPLVLANDSTGYINMKFIPEAPSPTSPVPIINSPTPTLSPTITPTPYNFASPTPTLTSAVHCDCYGLMEYSPDNIQGGQIIDFKGFVQVNFPASNMGIPESMTYRVFRNGTEISVTESTSVVYGPTPLPDKNIYASIFRYHIPNDSGDYVISFDYSCGIRDAANPPGTSRAGYWEIVPTGARSLQLGTFMPVENLNIECNKISFTIP